MAQYDRHHLFEYKKPTYDRLCISWKMFAKHERLIYAETLIQWTDFNDYPLLKHNCFPWFQKILLYFVLIFLFFVNLSCCCIYFRLRWSNGHIQQFVYITIEALRSFWVSIRQQIWVQLFLLNCIGYNLEPLHYNVFYNCEDVSVLH